MERENEKGESERLRERLSILSEACLRINETLDLETVLQDVVDSARIITGSRYAGISTIDSGGQGLEFLTSGMSPEAKTWLADMPEGPAFFEYLLSLTEPLRIGDFQSHIRELGMPDFNPPVPVTSVLATSLRARGETVGVIYLSKGEGGQEFSPEDEETLVMFASQAALVIANARRHREEQRVRADLETLVNTVPVGVAVFDATTGGVVSTNREMRRIASGLHGPEGYMEELLHVVTFRRGDGREISLKEASLPELLRIGETVRAEEIILRVPDGPSITTLMNTTPIRSEEGEVESVVVTLQDMTPLEDLERLRAEFLALVSHELRTPLTAIRGSATALLDDFSGLHPVERRQFSQIILDQTDRMRGLIADLLDVALIETGTLSVSPEPTDLTALMDDVRTTFLSGGHKHSLQVDLVSGLPWVMADRFRIVQVLGNLLTNAAKRSPESSSIRVTAALGEFQVAVSVSDDGQGIPAESLPNLFRKFFRVATEEQGGDTGLGLAVCKGIVEAHGGRIWAESDGPGLGARFTFTLPLVEDSGFVSPFVSPRPRAATGITHQNTGEQVRILAVDDEPQALRYIKDVLVKAGYAAIATSDPKEVPWLLQEHKPHLVLLDLMLPGVSGIDLMSDIVEKRDVPVIFVSAYGQDQLIAQAFDMGATDYVVKPFSTTELVARIKAALRRRETAEPTAPYAFGDLVIDYAERLVTLAGKPLAVTAIQYNLLLALSTNAGRVQTYAQLLQQVWDDDADGDVRPMRTAISSLRRMLGDDAANPTYIFTEPRVGYRMPGPEGLGPGLTGSR